MQELENSKYLPLTTNSKIFRGKPMTTIMQTGKHNMDNLTKQELGKLFPIVIVPPNSNWVNLFEKEKKIIIDTLGEHIALKVEHFGSTSVPNLAAKPTIDILVEIPSTDDFKNFVVDKMKNIDYHFIWRTDCGQPYMMFVKGYSSNGIIEQTYHIHMAPKSHPLWDRLYFRDYLKQHPEIAKNYEEIKYQLAEKHKYDREDYTTAKTEFITKVTEIAKNENKKTADNKTQK
jgi:GrpB-like predicted nucleotidyltransferase (UPF0157 family)